MSATREISILGVILTIAQPYTEGHVVNEAEAKALNQTRAENISNALRAKVKAKQSEDGTYTPEALEKITAMAAAYDAEYTFTLGGTGGGRTPTDPLEKECIAVARQFVTAKLKEAGKKVKELSEGQMDAYIAQVVDAPEIVDLAKQRLKQREKLSAKLDFAI